MKSIIKKYATMLLKGRVMMFSIWIAGDSTASSKKLDKRPESGWGEYLGEYLSQDIIIRNLAENGRSTTSFIREGKLDLIDQGIQKNDILLIQFGHNDQKSIDPNRYADVNHAYPNQLKHMIEVALKHDALPVCLTPITRRDFVDGVLNENTHLGYPMAMKKLCHQEGIMLIDLFKITQDLLTDLGEEASTSLFLHLKPGESPNYPHGVMDNTHLNETGARLIASIIALHIKKIRA
jgi:lysophospholipase L1-like esterase